MTMITDRAPAHPAIPLSHVQDVWANLASKARAFRAARKAALLKKKTDLIVSGLDAHILRDIGLDPEIAKKRDSLAFHHRAGMYGLW